MAPRMYYQISLPIKTAQEYSRQLSSTFDCFTKVIKVNNWGAVYTSRPIPPEGFVPDNNVMEQNKTHKKEISK